MKKLILSFIILILRREVAKDALNIYTCISPASYSIGGKYFAGDGIGIKK